MEYIYMGMFYQAFSLLCNQFNFSLLQVRPKNVVKDFVHVAGVLNVSHMLMFTRTQVSPYLKVSRFPRGPTMTFKIDNYTLSRDVRSALKRQVTYDKQYLNHPLLILNGFSTNQEEQSNETTESGDIKKMGGREIGLVSSMFQNMFPSINVTSVKVNTIRRCVLINLDAKTQKMEFRHYTIKVVPVGMSKPLKKIVQGKVPNLSRYQDMSEYLAGNHYTKISEILDKFTPFCLYITFLDRCAIENDIFLFNIGGGALSESEAEDDPEISRVTLPQGLSSRGNMSSEQSSVRLVELGPRMTMSLVKIEEGMHDGEVLYHKFVEKTESEKREIKKAREKRKKEKETRKKVQEQNVKKKEQGKEDHKQKSLEGMMKKKIQQLKDSGEGVPAQFQGEMADTSSQADGKEENDMSEDDADEEWYRKEVGEEPEKDLFDGNSKGRKRPASNQNIDTRFKKRIKKSTEHRQNKEFKNKRSPSTKKGNPSKTTEAKWKFKGASSKENNKFGHKDSFSKNKKTNSKDKKKSKKVFNSEGVGPNYKKNLGNKKKSYDSARGSKSKHRK